MQIFPKKAKFGQIASSPRLFTPTCKYFYTNIFVIFVTFRNSGDGFPVAVLPDYVMRQEGDGGVEEEIGDVEGDRVEPEDGLSQTEGQDCQRSVGLVGTPVTLR